jgi:ABC-type amino acid transport substrate-binding protein
MENIHFWNGNKSPARQDYETAVLRACIGVTTAEYGAAGIQIDNTDYPSADDEAKIFTTGTDILVTVAGNVKFKDQKKLMIPQPLTKGLLGYRLLIVRNESLAKFAQISTPQQLQALSIGIPKTWADAELFRHNGYKVNEQGSLDDLFIRLKNGLCDYVALGVNEIEQIFNERASPLGELSIEPSLLLYYDFPLVFYIHVNQATLAERIQTGLKQIMDNGEFEILFTQYHGDLVPRLKLPSRKKFILGNPILPAEMANFSSSLLD